MTDVFKYQIGDTVRIKLTMFTGVITSKTMTFEGRIYYEVFRCKTYKMYEEKKLVKI
jgi:hypothetical protein